MSKQHDVFLSYSRKDLKQMQEVRDALRAQDIKVWTDEYLEPGTPVWQSSIEQAIRDSRSLVVLLSPDSTTSKWVRSEISMADDVGLTIFPILIRGEKSSDVVPLAVYASQWIDLRSKFETSSIVAAVQKQLAIKSRAQLEAEILNLQAALKTEREEYARERAKLILQAENANDKSAIQALLDETTRQYTDSLRQIESLTAQVQSKNAAENKDLLELQSKLGNLEIDYKAAQDEIKQLQSDLNNARDAQNKGDNEQITSLQAQLTASENEHKEAKKQVQELEKDLRSYKSRPTQATVQSLRSERDTLQNENKSLNSRIQLLEKENKALKEQSNKASSSPIPTPNSVKKPAPKAASTTKDTETGLVTWAFAIIMGLLFAIIGLNPNINLLVDSLGGATFGTAPISFTIGAFILLGVNLLIGGIEFDDSMALGLGFFAFIIWFVLFLGIFPDSWLGTWTSLLLGLTTLSSVVAVMLIFELNPSDNTGFLVIWMSAILAFSLLLIVNVYGLLVSPLSQLLDGWALTLAAIVLAVLIPVIVIGIAGWLLFSVTDGWDDGALGMVFALIAIISFSILLWLYQFGGWQVFVASVSP